MLTKTKAVYFPVCNANCPHFHIIHSSPVQSSPCAERSERVILRRYLNREELVQDGDFLHDVVAHLGNFGEEEEGEESGYTAEAGGEAAAVDGLVYASGGEGGGGGRRTISRLA